MMKILNKKALSTIFTAALVVAAAVMVWNYFGIGARIKLSGAIDDILAARQVAKAREALKEIDDRTRVVAALKDAVEEDTDSVQGKSELIDTLSAWKEGRAARRALESKSISSRRAAAWKFHGDEAVRDIVRRTIIDWIRDEGADRRNLAAMVASKLKIKEVIPTLLEAIHTTPKSASDTQFANSALDYLSRIDPIPEGLAQRVMELALDTDQHMIVRAKAFDIVGRLDEVPQDKAQELFLRILADPEANNFLRNKAATALRKEKFGNPDVWKGLEQVLLRENDDGIVQRACLYALGSTAPLDRVKKLLLDRRVYRHPYFGIRVDVAAALATLRVQERIALEILCDYVVDNDPDDLALLVPQEGWISYWALTGMAYGVAQPRLFQRQPRPITGEKFIRDNLWRSAQMRTDVSYAMVEEVKRMITANLDAVNKSTRTARARPRKVRRMEDLKRVSQIMRQKIDDALADIKKREEREKGARKAKEEKKAEEAKKKIDTAGPPAPPVNKNEQKKTGGETDGKDSDPGGG